MNGNVVPLQMLLSFSHLTATRLNMKPGLCCAACGLIRLPTASISLRWSTIDSSWSRVRGLGPLSFMWGPMQPRSELGFARQSKMMLPQILREISALVRPTRMMIGIDNKQIEPHELLLVDAFHPDFVRKRLASWTRLVAQLHVAQWQCCALPQTNTGSFKSFVPGKSLHGAPSRRKDGLHCPCRSLHEGNRLSINAKPNQHRFGWYGCQRRVGVGHGLGCCSGT